MRKRRGVIGRSQTSSSVTVSRARGRPTLPPSHQSRPIASWAPPTNLAGGGPASPDHGIANPADRPGVVENLGLAACGTVHRSASQNIRICRIDGRVVVTATSGEQDGRRDNCGARLDHLTVDDRPIPPVHGRRSRAAQLSFASLQPSFTVRRRVPTCSAPALKEQAAADGANGHRASGPKVDRLSRGIRLRPLGQPRL
jgi:hypothetical protein